MKVSTITLGCKVNQYETQAMLNQLLQGGFSACQTGEDADIILLNSCTVTSTSDHKVKQTLHKARREHPHAVIVLTGCMPQAFPELAEDLTDADIVLGNSNRSSLLPHILQYLSTRQRIIDIVPHQTKEKFESMSVENFYERTRAFIKIQDGCNRFCSYCIIPYTRGRIRSRELDDILKEVHRLADNGYQEIVLTGIHLTSYGVDNQKGSLLEVISRIHEIEGVKRIRLGSLEPRVVTEEFVSALAAMEKVCPHFHLSLQSGCDSVLKRMNRKYTTAEYEEGCRILRKYFNNPAITTDVIVGFPQETEEEFETTYDFVKRIHFYEMHVFKYSRRKGTVADKMDGQVDEKIKTQRSGCLLALEKEMSAAYRKESLGQTMQVLIEEKMTYNGTDYMAGYTKNYIRVLVPVSDRMTEAAVNTIVNVNCKQITEDELYIIGELS